MKRRSVNKISAWILGIIMIISIIQIPAFGMNAKAADNAEVVVLDDNAEDGQGVRYSFSKDDNYEAYVCVESDENIPDDGNIIIPSKVSWQGTEYVVTYIDEYGFQPGKKIRRIVLPSTLTCIGEYAFAGLTNLESVTTDSNNVEIRNNAFEDCTSLSTFLFNGGTIGESSFKRCSNLSNFNFENVTSISQRAFDGCINLTDVNLPTCVEYVGDRAFSGCPDTIIVACDSLLDESYFWWNENMVRAQHTEPVYGGCIDGGTSHVWNCEKCGMTVIGKHVLNKERQCEICGAMIEVYIEDLTDFCDIKEDSQGLGYSLGSTEEGKYASFYTWNINIMPHTEWLVVPDVVRFEGEEYPVTVLGANVFERLRELEYIELPSGLKKIENGAFWGVTKMTSIELPEGLEVIEDNAFRDNVGLESIYIPASVNCIGNLVFYGCTNLKKIVIAEGSKLDVGSIYWGVDAEIVDENASEEDDPSDDNPDENNADEVTIDGVVYQLSAVDNTAKVIGYDSNQLPEDGEVLIPSYISYDNEEYYVRHIEARAFEGCVNIIDVTLPEGLKYIDYYVFHDCSNLKSIVIPEGVTEIGHNAFQGCENLTSVKLPDGLKYIKNYAFYDCNNLVDIELPDGLEKIEWDVFLNCTSLKSIIIPDSVTQIGSGTFMNCQSLTSVTLPKGLKNIEHAMFFDCRKLEDIVLPEGLESIESNAFLNAKSLKSIVIPNSVIDIGQVAFCGCDNLENISLPDGLQNIEFRLFEECGSLTHIVIPEGVKNIGPLAFSGCKELASIVIPDGVECIGQLAFERCQNLKSAEFPESLKEIDKAAFRGCSSLEFISIPDSVERIGEGAFSGCTSLGRFGIACRSLLEISPSWGVDSDLILYEHDMTKVDAVLSCTDVGSLEYFVCSYEPDVYYVDEDGRSVYDDYQSIIVAPIPHTYENGKCIYCGKVELDGIEYEDDGIIYLLYQDGSEEAAVIGYNDEHLADNTKLVIEGSMFIYGTNYTVTTIMSNAFADCDKLRSVRIADSIANVGDNAFANCKNLEWIKFECGSNMVANENWGIDAKIVSNDWHRYSTTVPTDNQDGTHQKVCEKCHQTINEAHDYTARTYQKEALAVPATCTEPAKYYFLCDCGLMSSDDTYEAHHVFNHVDAYGDMPLGHNMVKVEASEPTCTKDGNIEYWVCTNEPDVYYMDENRIEKNDAIAIPMISHVFEDGKCIVCGELASKQVVARGAYLGVIYELYDYGNDHFATVVGLSDNITDTNFIIYEGVDYYEGTVYGEVGRYKVTAIADGAFKGSSRLVYLHIKKNVKEIGDNAFEGCENLRKISLSCDSELNLSDFPEVNQSIVTRFNHVPNPEVHSVDNYDSTHTGKCWDCGKEYVSVHDFCRKIPNEQTRALAATCTTPAAYYYTCDCGAFGYGVMIIPGGSVPNQLWYLDSEPALGHDMTKVAAKEATTTATGNYEYWICSREPDVYYKDKEGTQQFKNWSEVVIPKIINNGWYKYDNKWCYNRDGKRVTGWLLDGKNWYYMDSNGYMKTGWQKIGTKWYYFGTDGVMVTGWKKISNVWYYFDGGAMVTGWKKISSKWYYFDGGAMVTGWQKIGTKWYYFGNDGIMVTGWQKISSKWYYFDGGAMVTGWQKIGTKWYYFGNDGIMVTGWQKISNNWYYFDGGVMATSRWINNTYYVKSNGVMAINEWIGKYYVDANGKYVPGKRK